jgi:hypothetical protein
MFGLENLSELVGVVRHGGRSSVQGGLFESSSNVGLHDGRTDKQQASENLVFLRQSHHFLFHAERFQVHGNQDIMMRVFRHQRHDLVDSRHVLTREPRIEPTSSVELANLLECQFGNLTRSIRSAVNTTVMNADQLSIFGFLHIKFETES